jgi:glutathionylspermidine synthase
MRREHHIPRPDHLEKIERLGLTFHTIEGQCYWNESAAYVFTPEEIACLESTTNLLHQMCLEAVEHVIVNGKYDAFNIPKAAHKVIAEAWETDPPAIYGRFDLCYDGTHPPKMLEYNADTPTSLLEGAVIQWHWLQDVHPQNDQFNSIWEGLVDKWLALKREGYFPAGLIHFGCMDEMEDLMTTAVLMDTAQEAGLQVEMLQMAEIGWHQLQEVFVDKEQRRIQTLFKLYPWEWLLADEFGQYVLQRYSGVNWIEPIWKMLLSNKAILAVLWELYPDHPNLLPAYFDRPDRMEEYVRKPILGREGANVSIVSSSQTIDNEGPYGGNLSIYQGYAPLPNFEGNHAVIGSWVIDGVSRGIGIRESDGPITGNQARFVPHFFTSAGSPDEPTL